MKGMGYKAQNALEVVFLCAEVTSHSLAAAVSLVMVRTMVDGSM